ncbi:MAG: type II toxin-antitoxin system prevent-host-death family antitoxin [Pseudorhizobium pelagicum]|uniref:type II toxin-antitoxin system Phd/YefM family antitoxin n=1 Tax=Pseudorhizobium pelagicum TaxID=1509405 RepID=UPI0034613260
MRISVAEAEGKLAELVARAQRGEDVVLTQHGKPALQLVSVAQSPLSPEERLEVFARIRKRARKDPSPFEGDAARSQDFLYDEFGLPK